MADRAPGLVPVLRSGRFLVFSITQAISLLGDKLDYMALLAMIAFFSARGGWESSRSIAALSVVVALPTVLLGPLAGVFVDRRDRRKVMISCDAARTVLVAAIPFVALATANAIPVFGLAFLVFCCGLLFNTARLATIPGLVDDEHGEAPERLLAANSFMNFTGRLATFAGMLIGGFAVEWSGWLRFGIRHPWTAGFLLDALTYLISVLGLVFIYRRMVAFRPAPRESRRNGGTVLHLAWDRARNTVGDLTEAWRLAAKSPTVLFVYGSVLAFVTLGAGIIVLYVPLIQGGREIAGLGMGTHGVGLIAGIGSIGLVLSSAGYGVIGHRARKYPVMVAAFAVLSVSAILLALTRSFVVVAFVAFTAGLALSPVNIGMDTLLHESVPSDVRGRIFSSREWILHLAFAFNALVIGQLTRFLPKRGLLLGIGILVLLATGAGFFLSRRRAIA